MNRPVDIPHKDYQGKTLYVGARVAFIRNHYREFQKGTIVKVNPRKITIEILGKDTTQRYPEEVIRLD